LLERCEDRLFFGPPKLLLQLRFLARDIPHLFAPFQTNDRINTNSSRKDIVIRSNRTSKRSARHNGASRAETSKSRHSRSSHRSLGARTDNRSSINSNNVLFNQNGGRNTKSKTFTRALMLAHLKPAKTFSPETLLYEYISAIAAHRRANVSSMRLISHFNSSSDTCISSNCHTPSYHANAILVQSDSDLGRGHLCGYYWVFAMEG